MIVKELLDRVTLEEMLPYLRKKHADNWAEPTKTHKGTADGYRSAFEELKSLAPAIQEDRGDETLVAIRVYHVHHEWDSRFDGEHFVEDYNAVDLVDRAGGIWSASFVAWDDILGLEVRNEIEGLPLSAQLAEILWEITYYGYSQAEMNKEREKLDAAYEEALTNPERCVPLTKPENLLGVS